MKKIIFTIQLIAFLLSLGACKKSDTPILHHVVEYNYDIQPKVPYVIRGNDTVWAQYGNHSNALIDVTYIDVSGVTPDKVSSYGNDTTKVQGQSLIYPDGKWSNNSVLGSKGFHFKVPNQINTGDCVGFTVDNAVDTAQCKITLSIIVDGHVVTPMHRSFAQEFYQLK